MNQTSTAHAVVSEEGALTSQGSDLINLLFILPVCNDQDKREEERREPLSNQGLGSDIQ